MSSNVYGRFSQGQVVTINGRQTIHGVKTFDNVILQNVAVSSLSISNNITFGDGSTQTTAYKSLVPGSYINASVLVNSLGQISSITAGLALTPGDFYNPAITVNSQGQIASISSGPLLTPGSFANSNITVNGNGQISSVSEGSQYTNRSEMTTVSNNYYPLFVTQTGTNPVYISSTNAAVNYNPNTDILKLGTTTGVVQCQNKLTIGPSSTGTSTLYIEDPTGIVSSLGKDLAIFSDTSAGTYRQLRFMPNASGGNYNPMTLANSALIYSKGAVKGNTPLVLAAWSENATGVAITDTSTEIGWGGTASSTPTNSLKFSSSGAVFNVVPKTSIAPTVGSDLCNKTYVDAYVPTNVKTINTNPPGQYYPAFYQGAGDYPTLINTSSSSMVYTPDVGQFATNVVFGRNYMIAKGLHMGSKNSKCIFLITNGLGLPNLTTGDFNCVVGDNCGTALAGGSNNFAMGVNSFYSCINGCNNCAMGHRSLQSLGASGSFSTAYNTGVGDSAMLNANAVYNCTAIGGVSGSGMYNNNNNCTTIGYNANCADGLSYATSIGADAYCSTNNTVQLGKSNGNVNCPGTLSVAGSTTIGAQEVKISSGYFGFGASTSDLSNVIIGNNSSRTNFNTNGYNVLIGANIGTLMNIAAARNIVIGGGAGNQMGNCSDNVLIGYQCGDAISSGSDNIMIGTDSGGLTSNGNRNIFIGRGASNNNTSGSSNVVIGYNSAALNTGSNNIYIGAGVTPPTASSSNQIVLGDSTCTQFIPGGLRFLVGADITATTTLPTSGTVLAQFYNVTISAASQTVKLPNPTNYKGAKVLLRRKTNNVAFTLGVDVVSGSYIIAAGAVTASASINVATTVYILDFYSDGAVWLQI